MTTRPTFFSYLLIALALVVIAGAVALWMRGSLPTVSFLPSGSASAAQAASTPAATDVPAKDVIVTNRDTVRVSAKLMPVKRAMLSLPTGGQVVEVIASEGGQIKAGQALLRLESGHQQLAVDQATLALNQTTATARQANAGYLAAYSTLERTAKDLNIALSSTQIVVTPFVSLNANAAIDELTQYLDEVDLQTAQLVTVTNLPLKSVQAQLLSARAAAVQAALTVFAAKSNLQQAQLALNDRELLAPFDGTVAQINVKVGDFTAAGASLVAFADFNQWRLETEDLTERDLSKVVTGQELKFTLDAYPDVFYTGKVTDIRSMGQPRAGDVLFTAYLAPGDKKPEWRWNMAATVLLNSAPAKK